MKFKKDEICWLYEYKNRTERNGVRVKVKFIKYLPDDRAQIQSLVHHGFITVETMELGKVE